MICRTHPARSTNRRIHWPTPSPNTDDVERSRVGHITKGYASGGAVHSDEAEDRKMVKGMVKKSAMKAEGEKPKHRADKPHRAKGGRVKHKGTTVNVMVAPPHGGVGAVPVPVPGAAGPMPPPGAQPMAAAPPGPPMLPPPGMGPGMGPRAHGGRAYKSGGRVGPESMEAAAKDAEAHRKSGDKDTKGPSRGFANRGTKVFEASLRNGTKVDHSPGKNDQSGLDRGKPFSYKRGGAVEAPGPGKGMGPDLEAGVLTGEARIKQADRYARRHG